MTMFLFHGKKGSGKTLNAVKCLYEKYKEGRTIYSNIHLNFPHKPITKEVLNEILKQNFLSEAVIFLDEVHTIVDCRRSMTGNSIKFGAFFTQSRKRNVDVIGTTQFIGQVDIRFRNNCDYFLEHKKIYIDRKIQNPKFIILVSWFDNMYNYLKPTFIKSPSDYFNLYDTNQIIYYDWQDKKEKG